MKKRWFYLGLLLVAVVISLVQGYASWVNREAFAKNYITWSQNHPFSPLDFYGGFWIGVTATLLIFAWFSVREAKRFEDGLKGGDGGPSNDGGGGRKIRLPMSRKVVAIDDFRKAPTDGRIHMGVVSA